MKTSLSFQAPPDLSLGRVEIAGKGGVLGEWISTPGDHSREYVDIEPGFYRAEIAPVGARSQSVIFEVHEGVANTVALPSFTALAATGSGESLISTVENRMLERLGPALDKWRAAASELSDAVTPERGDSALAAVVKRLLGATDRLLSRGAFSAAELAKRAAATPSAKSADVPANGDLDIVISAGLGGAAEQADVTEAPRCISVGISQERLGKRESWGRFTGSSRVEMAGGNLVIEAEAPEDWSPGTGVRFRMSVAIERERVQRLLLPMYRAGLTITLAPSPLSPADVEVMVMPSDPRVRALWRALGAGSTDDARAVREHVLKVKGDDPALVVEQADPWEAMLAGLLFLRFPEVFGPLSGSWSERLASHCDWAYDAHVIRARQLLSAASEDPVDRQRRAADAVASLLRAQACGAPYFSHSNNLFGEMAEALCHFGELNEKLARKITKARDSWRRNSALQACGAINFMWLRRDQAKLAEGLLIPDRRSSGLLRARDTTVIYRGEILYSQLSFASSANDAPKAAQPDIVEVADSAPPPAGSASRSEPGQPRDCPALARKPGPRDDPNKGRFGAAASVQGATLSATFEETGKSWVRIALTVEVDPETAVKLGDSVWFCLHPTFDPNWVKVMFRGRRATLAVTAWGGFTVGAWLPSQAIELECDLSSLADAPEVIREL